MAKPKRESPDGPPASDADERRWRRAVAGMTEVPTPGLVPLRTTMAIIDTEPEDGSEARDECPAPAAWPVPTATLAGELNRLMERGRDDQAPTHELRVTMHGADGREAGVWARALRWADGNRGFACGAHQHVPNVTATERAEGITLVTSEAPVCTPATRYEIMQQLAYQGRDHALGRVTWHDEYPETAAEGALIELTTRLAKLRPAASARGEAQMMISALIGDEWATEQPPEPAEWQPRGLMVWLLSLSERPDDAVSVEIRTGVSWMTDATTTAQLMSKQLELIVLGAWRSPEEYARHGEAQGHA